MMKPHWKSALGILALAGILGASPLSAQTPQRAEVAATAKKPALDLKTKRIIGLDWHGSLEAAIAANEKRPKEARPILFLRVLGDLEGKT